MSPISDEFSTVDDQESFFRVLGSGTPAQVPEDSTADEDAVFERNDANAVTLYKVSDSSGALKVDPISTKPIRQDMLKSEVSYFYQIDAIEQCTYTYSNQFTYPFD